MATKDQEIADVAAALDGLLDELAESVAAISAILKRPQQPPADNNVKVVPSD